MSDLQCSTETFAVTAITCGIWAVEVLAHGRAYLPYVVCGDRLSSSVGPRAQPLAPFEPVMGAILLY